MDRRVHVWNEMGKEVEETVVATRHPKLDGRDGASEPYQTGLSPAHFPQPQQPSTTILSTLTTNSSGMPETLPTLTAEYQADAKAMVPILAARIRTMLQSPKTGQTETQVVQSAVSYYNAEHNPGQLLTHCISEQGLQSGQRAGLARCMDPYAKDCHQRARGVVSEQAGRTGI